MFKGKFSIFIVAVVAMTVMPAMGVAAEHGGQEHGGATSAPSSAPAAAQPSAQDQGAAPAQSSAAPAPAPAIPAALPALKPIVITFSGDLVSVDAKGTPAMITVKDRYGVTKEIGCPAEAKVMQGGNAKMLADLKTGDKITVEYTYDVATGKRTAQSISVGEAAAPAPTS